MATNALAPTPVNALMQRVKGIASQGYDYVAGRAKALYEDPIGDMKATLKGTQKRLDEFGALQSKAFGDKSNPLKITDQEAMGLLGEQALTQIMGFAPVGIIGYHGTTKDFKNFSPKRGVTENRTSEAAFMNSLGPHFSEDAAGANKYMRDQAYWAHSMPKDWMPKGWRGDPQAVAKGVYQPKANIRRVDVPLENPFNAGSEDIFERMMQARDIKDIPPHLTDHLTPKELQALTEVTSKINNFDTWAEYAAHMKKTLQEHGFDGIKYTGSQRDIEGVSSFIPFNVKDIKPAWGGK